MQTSRILTDSLDPLGNRLTTWELTYPRAIHSELLTHRTFSRNSASSRAIPSSKLIEQVETNPFIPIHWGKNQPGMQAGEEIEEKELATFHWLKARDKAVESAKKLLGLGIHKQVVNRIIEPWMYITVILSGTDFSNFFFLRRDKAAEPHIKVLADEMFDLYQTEKPTPIKYLDWHLPLTNFPGDEKLTLEEKKKVSVGRCARVSYLTHTGKRDIQADLDLYERLKTSNHWSPFEHVAKAMHNGKYYANFRGYRQLRSYLESSKES